MTLTRELLDTRYAWWFHNKRNAEQAKREILIIFSKELDDCFEWTEQDIYEQSRKIIRPSDHRGWPPEQPWLKVRTGVAKSPDTCGSHAGIYKGRKSAVSFAVACVPSRARVFSHAGGNGGIIYTSLVSHDLYGSGSAGKV